MKKMPDKPTYTITEKAADYLVKIVESVTRLEFGTDFKRDIKLHRKNRVRSIYSSLAIEGNSLSLGEVTDVIEGKLVAGQQAEIKEVKNAYEAYDKVMGFNPYSVEDFLKAHKLMTDGLVEESGTFRSGDVGVFDGDVVVHVGARPQFVPQLITELFDWAQESELHPVLKSAIMHCEIETIHPFADGNGRMGRLWQTLLLAKWNDIFAWVPMESVVFEKRPKYYETLNASQRANDSSKFIEFTLSAILDTITQQALHEAEHINEPINEPINEHINEHINNPVLNVLRKNPQATNAEIADATRLSRATITRHLQRLKTEGLIKRVGSNKTGYWEILE